MTIEQLEKKIAVLEQQIAAEESSGRFGRRDAGRISRLRQELFALRHDLKVAKQPKDHAWDLAGRINQRMDRFQIADLLRAELQQPTMPLIPGLHRPLEGGKLVPETISMQQLLAFNAAYCSGRGQVAALQAAIDVAPTLDEGPIEAVRAGDRACCYHNYRNGRAEYYLNGKLVRAVSAEYIPTFRGGKLIGEPAALPDDVREIYKADFLETVSSLTKVKL